MTADCNAKFGELSVDSALAHFIRDEALTDTDVSEQRFWAVLESLLRDFAQRNADLLGRRQRLEMQINQWHKTHQGERFDTQQYRSFLEEIGYLEAPVQDFELETRNLDAEVSSIAAPQLVVPLDNPRYAINAVNARWGSLFDALYGTDVIPPADGAPRATGYNPVRGARVAAYAHDLLDRCFPLLGGSHKEVVSYGISDSALSVQLPGGRYTRLTEPSAFRGYIGAPIAPNSIFLLHNDLYVELRIDRNHPIGREAAGGVCDVILESAVTTILDCEDAVAAVDGTDKVRIYRNWLGLTSGTLSAAFQKGSAVVERVPNLDRTVKRPNGESFDLPGRGLMLIRHVGHHVMTTAVNFRGKPIPEFLLDALVTVFIATRDVKGPSRGRNSRRGSIYCVKPKMHGSAEVALAVELFARLEECLGLSANCIKLGLMDEERRTSINLKNCIYAARSRLFFINTGFLDRTGDDIHTTMEAGPTLPKASLKRAPWLQAYELNNVAVGLGCGLAGRAQIGKGMWTQPDRMAEMMATKIAHLRAGASTSWVPSPTAAVLHALHYHAVRVREVQQTLTTSPPPIDVLLAPAVADAETWPAQVITREVEANAQSILGYVVRWIEHGIGCSKVLDIDNVALMEDRATLRISSQILANLLRHGLCTRQQVEASLEGMAQVVDLQNEGDPAYMPMSRDIQANYSLNAARELIFGAADQPNGYTEPTLWKYRVKYKQIERS